MIKPEDIMTPEQKARYQSGVWLRKIEEQWQEFLKGEKHQLVRSLKWDEATQTWRETP